MAEFVGEIETESVQVPSQAYSSLNESVDLDSILYYQATDDSRELSPSSRRAGGAEEWTVKDVALVRLKLLWRAISCRERPHFRWIRSKGAILVLLWVILLPLYDIFVPLTTLFLETVQLPKRGPVLLPISFVQALLIILPCPLAGWLADVYFGRYQVIKVSLWLLWAGAMLFSFAICLQMFLSPSDVVSVVIVIIFLVALLAMVTGVAGFLANSLPFGIDQLSTATGEELSAFITWFVFNLCIRTSISNFLLYGSCFNNTTKNALLWAVTEAVLLSIALVLDSILNKDWLIVEPSTSNPFKLVAGVLKYAWTHKYPAFRSAFTYHDHMRPSRIDYAKAIYGGPFSTEQVEDVKTFLRITSVLVPMGAAVTIILFAYQASSLFSLNLDLDSKTCYTSVLISTTMPFLTIIVCILIYEFLIYPILHNYILSTLFRFGIGIIFSILSIIAHFTVNIETEINVANSTCLLDPTSPENHIATFWSVIPQVLIGLGLLFSFIAIFEFVFSQSPHNMKGLFMGAIFTTTVIFEFLGVTMQMPFILGSLNNLTLVLSCNSVYFLVLLTMSIVCFIVYVLVARGYQRREREDTKRHQNYSEDYYSKYLLNRQQ